MPGYEDTARRALHVAAGQRATATAATRQAVVGATDPYTATPDGLDCGRAVVPLLKR